jgi:hypothetical protein
MSSTCLNLFDKLNISIEQVNYQLVDNMTKKDMKYLWACIQPDVTYDFYFRNLSENWNFIVNELVKNPNKCSSRISEIIELYQYVNSDIVKNIYNDVSNNKLNMSEIESLIFKAVADYIEKSSGEFKMSTNLFDTMKKLGKIYLETCNCELVDIFKIIVKKYKKKYRKKFEGKTKDEIVEILQKEFQNLKEKIRKLFEEEKIGEINFSMESIMEKISYDLTGIYGFSVEKELDRLIPNELGSLKDFFMKIIVTYYNNLHPIVWAQIYRSTVNNLFVDLPSTPKEIFAFFSKQLLLNSGPFILKILQLIRPAISPQLAEKYNLTKLTYPLLSSKEVNLMLSRVVYEWDMYEVLENYSASVGHVVKVKKANYPLNVFIIKMIKPLAIAQSCWEYKTLYNVFSGESCEATFIKNILKSNGEEMNVKNEIENLEKGHQYYVDNYKDVFSIDLNANLSTVQNIPGILNPECWYALSMTVAPGIPLSKLVENDLVKNDTKYRAKLHRCLDVLVYKFYLNIIRNGFYHADLHAGNIFFSYEKSQLTLIDFGSTGELDVYSEKKDTKVIIDIIIKSLFYNYDEILDELTEYLNTVCTDTQIDMTSKEYMDLRNKLYDYRLVNLKLEREEKTKSKMYKKDIFGEKRIEEEKSNEMENQQKINFDPDNPESIYSYLEIPPPKKETIVENRDVLPEFKETFGNKETISIVGALEMIVKFYALQGTNIAVKFSEFYEFQKAYALLLGVLNKVKYNMFRAGFALDRAIKNWENISVILHVGAISYMVQQYFRERAKAKNIKEYVMNNPNMQIPKKSESELDEYYLNKIAKYQIKCLNIKHPDTSHKTKICYSERI